jgi:hypothetical protein
MSKRPVTSRTHAAGALASLVLAGSAAAGEHVYPLTSETYRTECGACHVPYPPQLLPAPAWKRVVAGLADHFGSDASLSPEAAAEVDRYLQREAGRPGRGSESLRITDTPWFHHEHQGELPASVWATPSVRSAANCEACHTRAGQGDFGERSLRVPR